MTVSNYSTTAINNTSINGVNISEGMSPSDVNNSIREQLKDVRSVWNDKEWFLLGDGDGTTTFTRASATSITVASDITSSYHVGRRIKIVGSNTGTIFGKIATSAYSSPNTTVTFTFDSGTINASDSTVSVYVGSSYTNPGVSVVDEDNMASDSAVLPPSQQSVKAFVENLVTGQDLDVSDGSTAIAIDLDSETLGLLGGTGITSTASGNNVTMAIDSTVVTKTGTETLTNKTLTSPAINNGVLSTPDLNGTELILDADQDTSITADTDDKIDIKIGGSDKISATSSALTIGDNSSDYNTTMRGMLTINPVTSSGVVTALNLPQGDALQFGSGNTVIYKDRTSGVNYFRGDGTLSIKSDGVNIGNASLTSDRATIQSGFSGNTGDVTINHANLTTGTSNRLLTHSTGLNLYGAIQFKDTSNNNTASIDASGNITGNNTNITVSDGSNSTAINLGGTLTFDSNNFSESSGTVSVKTAGIGNTQVATGVDATKLADGSVTNAEFQYIGGLTSDAQTQLTGKLTASNNLSDVSSASTSRTNLGLGTISTQASNNVSITGGAISGLSLPTADTEASSKLYVDNAIAGMRTRIITKVATTGNVNLTNGLENGDSIDGITLQTGDKILVKSNTDATENGIYICPSSGTASRDTNYDTVEELAGQMIVVQQGSTNADKIFLCTTDNSGSIGSVNIVFSQITPANQGTVQSVAVADAGSSEFTVTGSPITSSGTINLAVNSINATKIGSGNVDNTELGYLNGVTSNIQTQLDNSASLGDAISFAVALGS